MINRAAGRPMTLHYRQKIYEEVVLLYISIDTWIFLQMTVLSRDSTVHIRSSIAPGTCLLGPDIRAETTQLLGFCALNVH